MPLKAKKKLVKQRLHSLALKVHLANIRGLHSNLNPVHHHLETEKPHLLFLTETQIRCPLDAAYLHYPGYTLEHSFKQRAGVCVYARDDICCRRLRNLEDSSFSTLWVLVDTGVEKILYCSVYRSHADNSETTRLFQHLSASAEVALQRYPSAQLVVLGDFNAHHQEWLFPFQNTDHAGRLAHTFSLTLGLSQLVNCATRIPDVDGHTANCLDLLLTTDPDRYQVAISSPLGSSDHCLVKSVSVYSPSVQIPTGTRRVWRYGSADWDEMRHFFASYPWRRSCFSSNDPTCCADEISGVILRAMEYFIPYSDVSQQNKARPWFNADCGKAEALKHSAYQSWADARSCKAPNVGKLKKAFNRATKSCKSTLRKARFDHISRIGAKLASYPSGSKAFWSLAKSVEANFCRSTLPPLMMPDGTLAHTAQEKADLFASLFASNSRLDATDKNPPTIPQCTSAMSEVHIRQKEVLKTLSALD